MAYQKIEHIPCDKERLISALNAHGTTLTQAAADAGYTFTWLSKAGSRGFLTPPQMVCLQSYGITREDVAPVKETEELTEDTVEEPGVVYVRNMTQGDLYETIFDAVRDALNGGRNDREN